MKIREDSSGRGNGKQPETQWYYLVKLPQARLKALGAKVPQANIENVNLLGEAEPHKATCKDFPFTKKALVDPGPMKQTEGSSGLL